MVLNATDYNPAQVNKKGKHMPKTTRKTTKKPATRSAVRGGSSSKKKGGLLGRLLPTKQGHWVLLIVVMAVVGGIGSWMLTSSNAGTTALSQNGCDLRGRTGYYLTGSTYYCRSASDGSPCKSGAGSFVNPSYGYGYCSGALSTSIGETKCHSLGRHFLANGCARRWQQTTKAPPAIQCLSGSATYYVTSGYDYCAASGTTSSGNIIVGSMAPVGGGYGGETNCVSFVKWVLDRHTNRYDGRATGNGGQVAANLRAAFGWRNVRAPHAVVSMPNSGGWSPGHVAIVDTVYSDGSIKIEESNWYGHYDTRTIPASLASGYSYAYSGSDWH